MKLNILTGRIARPQKTVIFGPEGIGKSTLAAQFPAPVFLDTEGGTHHLDVARLPAPKSWADVVAAIAALATEAHDFKTLVIDTADWLEKLLVDHVCKTANKASIEAIRSDFFMVNVLQEGTSSVTGNGITQMDWVRNHNPLAAWETGAVGNN